jgi:hypothetical protein
MALRCAATLFAASLCILIANQSWAVSMQPARIGEHENSLAKRIKFPDVEGDFTVFLRCEAKILPAGNVEELGCYSDEKIDEAFYRAVKLAESNASVTPATVDGKKVSILMLFTVVFKQQDDTRIIAVVPNHGTNAQELGMSYIAPQRYGRGMQYRPRSNLGLLWIDAEMSAAGEPSEIKYLDTKWTNKEAERYAKSYINDCTFIPGHLNGEPTSMRFVKPIFGYRNGFMWDIDNTRCRDSAISCDETSGTTGRARFVFDD